MTGFQRDLFAATFQLNADAGRDALCAAIRAAGGDAGFVKRAEFLRPTALPPNVAKLDAFIAGVQSAKLSDELTAFIVESVEKRYRGDALALEQSRADQAAQRVEQGIQARAEFFELLQATERAAEVARELGISIPNDNAGAGIWKAACSKLRSRTNRRLGEAIRKHLSKEQPAIDWVRERIDGDVRVHWSRLDPRTNTQFSNGFHRPSADIEPDRRIELVALTSIDRSFQNRSSSLSPATAIVLLKRLDEKKVDAKTRDAILKRVDDAKRGAMAADCGDMRWLAGDSEYSKLLHDLRAMHEQRSRRKGTVGIAEQTRPVW